jgi:ring-1,2-phenylacetyl-CoA epoxidase subunit PaaB
MDTFEVFRRYGHKEPFQHCGTVCAPDAVLALLLAKECYVRRREGDHIWVVRRTDIHSFKDESLLEIAADKEYRFPSAYRDVVEKRKRARARAEETATS